MEHIPHTSRRLAAISRRLFMLSATALMGCLSGSSPVLGQDQAQGQLPDTLRLADVRTAAVAQDPRSVQMDLLRRAAHLRVEALRASAWPQISLAGESTIQSDVPQVNAALPGGADLFSIPKEQYRVEANVEWSLYDGGLRRRQVATERARLSEQISGLHATLPSIREAASEAFFGILLLDAQRESMELSARDVEARLGIVRVRVREGAALGAEAAVLEAELIRLNTQVAEIGARRTAAVATLQDLIGLEIPEEAPFALPDLESEVAPVLAQGGAIVAARYVPLVERPEIRRLEEQADRMRLEARAIGARSRPVLSLFGRGGVGRPSPIDFLSDDVQPYGVVGVRVRWTALDWGRVRREAGAARVQADLLTSERDALARRFSREVVSEATDARRLAVALADDERAIRLREEAAFVAGRQVDEGVLLPDVYTDRLTDLAEARLTRERHRIELARARARILSTLGLFPEKESAPAAVTGE